jgi:hypothetical protein
MDRLSPLGRLVRTAATLGAVLSVAIGTLVTADAGATATAAPATTVPAAPVPPAYRAAYAAVQAQVQKFASGLSTAPPATGHRSPTYGVELLAANGNIGAGLLLPSALTGVRTELQAFASLGIRGVTLDVSYPLLLPGTPGHAGYLDFYERVAAAVRSAHMVLSVEENPVFVGTPLTSVDVSYAGLTPSSYAQGQRAEAQTIIDDLRPRYLSVLTEPDTFTDALGVPMNSASSATAMVKSELKGLRRGATLVGAGTGTWSDPAIDRALLAHTSIDYLDVHVYPLGAAQVANLHLDTAAAKAARRPLVMDETWLYKPSGTEGEGPSGAPVELKENSFSFWEPLDQSYVRAMTKYAAQAGYRYLAYFDGARAFFAYLAWSPVLQAASYQDFSRAYNTAVVKAMRAGAVSGTGSVLRQLLR